MINQKPLRPCNHPGCNKLSQKSYCDDHKPDNAERNRYYDKYKRNKKHDKFYRSSAWNKCRVYVKARDYGLCQHCLKDKKITPGVIVDHIIPLEIDWDKRLDSGNLQLLCLICHNKKTGNDLKKYKKT